MRRKLPPRGKRPSPAVTWLRATWGAEEESWDDRSLSLLGQEPVVCCSALVNERVRPLNTEWGNTETLNWKKAQ